MCNINLKNEKTMKQIIFILISLVCLCSCSNKTENKTNFSLKPNDKLEGYTDTIYYYTFYYDNIEYVDSVSYKNVIVTTNYYEINGKIYDIVKTGEVDIEGNSIEPITLDEFYEILKEKNGGELPNAKTITKSKIKHIKLYYYDSSHIDVKNKTITYKTKNGTITKKW